MLIDITTINEKKKMLLIIRFIKEHDLTLNSNPFLLLLLLSLLLQTLIFFLPPSHTPTLPRVPILMPSICRRQARPVPTVAMRTRHNTTRHRRVCEALWINAAGRTGWRAGRSKPVRVRRCGDNTVTLDDARGESSDQAVCARACEYSSLFFFALVRIDGFGENQTLS